MIEGYHDNSSFGPEKNLQIAGHVGRTQVYFFWPDELRRKLTKIWLLRWLNLWERIAGKREWHRKDALEICAGNHGSKAIDTHGFKALKTNDSTP